jgi:hypothetical protein
MATYAYGASGAPSANLGNPSVIDLVLGGTYVNTANGEVWHRISITGVISGSHFALACNVNNSNGDCNLQDATEVNFAGGIGFPGTVNTVDEALNYLVGLDVCGGGGEVGIEIEYSTTLVIAASNSTTRALEFADFICDGTDDHLDLQDAIDYATTSGYKEITLMEGDYYFTGTVTLATVIHYSTVVTTLFDLNTVNNVLFKNFVIDGNNENINYTFELEIVNDITFDNIKFIENFGIRTISIRTSFNNLVVRNCKFMDCHNTSYCIDIIVANTSNNYGVYVINNVFHNDLYTGASAIRIDVSSNDDDTVEEYSNKRIRHIIITNNEYSGYSTGSYTGRGQLCYVGYSDNIVIANNSIDYAKSAIVFDTCTSISINGNTITDCEIGIYASGDGWEIETGGGQYIWQITGNTIRDAYQGIAVVGNYTTAGSTRTLDDRRAYGLISGNSIKSNGSGALSLQVAANFNVTGNFLFCATTYAIEMLDCWEIVFTGNFLHGSLRGFDADDCYDLLIQGNFFSESKTDGLRISQGSDIVITDNYFIESGTNTNATYDHILIANASGVTNNITIKNNTFKVGYKSNTPRYCVNVLETAATNILIYGNDMRNGASTGTINIASGAAVIQYENWTSNGLSNAIYAGASNNKTIASDAITLSNNTSLIRLIPQTGTTDDLITINGGFDGQIIYLQTNDSSYTITLKSTGNLTLNGGDISLSATNIIQPLLYSGLLSKWVKA